VPVMSIEAGGQQAGNQPVRAAIACMYKHNENARAPIPIGPGRQPDRQLIRAERLVPQPTKTHRRKTPVSNLRICP
jgi:hypothetical protein